MGTYEIATLVLAIITIIMGVSWVTLFATGKSLIKNAKELRDKYRSVTANGIVTDVEKAELAQEAIDVIEDFIELWQQMVNIFYQVKKSIIRR